MSRVFLILNGAADRIRAKEYIDTAPTGTHVELKESTRTLEQNARLWAVLQIVAEHGELQGRKWNKEEWKAIFLQACGHEVRVLPTLDGRGFFPYGHSTRKLTVKQFTDLMDYIDAWCAENGIDVNEATEA